MTESQSPQTCDGDSAARVLAQPDESKPIVEATLVEPARESRPKAPPSSPGRVSDADAARQVRARRREEMFAIFFRHQAGALRIKRNLAHRLLDRVGDPVERDRLHALFSHCWNAAQSSPGLALATASQMPASLHHRKRW